MKRPPQTKLMALLELATAFTTYLIVRKQLKNLEEKYPTGAKFWWGIAHHCGRVAGYAERLGRFADDQYRRTLSS